MPIRKIPNTDQNYYLVNFDADGKERSASDGQLLSQLILDELKQQPVTDVFVMSHGWLGDIEDAQAQYDRWTANLWSCAADIAAIKVKRPGFRPLLVGIHWPSKPFGNEDAGGAFEIAADDHDVVTTAVNAQMAALDAPESVRPHLETIYNAYLQLDDPDSLPSEVREAYLAINRELGFDNEDRAAFDPEAVFQNAVAVEADQETEGSFGGFSLGNLLAPFRVLSFWRMKQRARSVGESGANDLLRKMQQAVVGVGREVRFHLMGHSFGCAVVSALTAGAPQSGHQAHVHSMILVQGALSLWAYCAAIPSAPDKPGYLNPLIKNNLVKGAIITTLSEYDSAVGTLYPLAAGLKGQVDFGVELPKYGGIGAFGIQGLDQITEGLVMKGKDEPYDFKPGHIYNLESSDVIKQKVAVVGAHSDIAHPEIAHVWWQAVMMS